MYEHRRQSLISRRAFAQRMARSLLGFLVLMVSFLGLGMIGYHCYAGLGWVDALLNASMILTGMGPVSPLLTDSAKIFASIYALLSGLVFLVAGGLVLAPVLHRLLHRFHLEVDDA